MHTYTAEPRARGEPLGFICAPRLQVIVKSGPGTFFGLAIYGDFIFWSDWARRAVLRSNKFTGGDTKVLRADIPHQPMGIIAVASDTNNCEWWSSWSGTSLWWRAIVVFGCECAQCVAQAWGQGTPSCSCPYLNINVLLL